MRKEIREDTAKKSVYPNRLIIPMAGSVDAMHVKCFEPTGKWSKKRECPHYISTDWPPKLGLVAVKIQSASNLPRKKGIRVVVGQDKPGMLEFVSFGLALELMSPSFYRSVRQCSCGSASLQNKCDKEQGESCLAWGGTLVKWKSKRPSWP